MRSAKFVFIPVLKFRYSLIDFEEFVRRGLFSRIKRRKIVDLRFCVMILICLISVLCHIRNLEPELSILILTKCL